MKKLLLSAAACVLLSTAALADGYDLTNKNIAELPTYSGAPASGDYDVMYDASADAFKKIDARAKTITTLTTTDATVSGSLLVPSEILTSTATVDSGDCGSIKFLSSATEFVTSINQSGLPAGCSFTFKVGAPPASASYTIKTGTAAGAPENLVGHAFDLKGGTGNRSIAYGVNDTITVVDGVAVKGDTVRLDFDGTALNVISFASSSGAVTFSSSL